MALGRSTFIKSVAQSTVVLTSTLFATQRTELLLFGLGAYLAAIRGDGWSPSLDEEARCAVRCLGTGERFIVIDAGANVGSWLTAFSKLVRSRGTIYAFEPQPAAASKIRELNLDQCKVFEVALGEQPGTCTFYTSEQTDTTGSLYERHDTFGGREYSSFEVTVVRLDDFVKENEIKRVDFMKMDLEGGEFNALKGAAECMRTGLLRAFSFEFGTSNVNSRVFFRDIFNLLVENNYSLSRITPAGRLIQIGNYTEDYESFARTTTYLAKRKDPF